MNLNKYILLIVFFNLLIFVIFFNLKISNLEQHELVHKAIAYNYGCTEHIIEINEILLEGKFACLNYDNRDYEETELMLHSMNEIVSYNLLYIGYILKFSFVILINVLFIINIDRKKIYI